MVQKIKCHFHNKYNSEPNFQAFYIYLKTTLIIILSGVFIFYFINVLDFNHKNILIIFLICVLGGAFGGYVAFYRENINNNCEFNNKTIKEKLITGIACGNLVPLFLNTISSTLIKEANKYTINYYIFLGLVILSSVFSNDFLTMMRKKVIEKDEKFNKLKEEFDKLQDQVNEGKQNIINPKGINDIGEEKKQEVKSAIEELQKTT